MDAIRKFGRTTFSSLEVRNYRLYFFGQSVSFSGTWMQGVAQGWLMLQLTGSGTELGSMMALQFLPLLLFGPWGGALVDRLDKRVIISVTNAAFAFVALVIGIAVALGVIQVWMLYASALLFGVIRIFDNPVRQSFVSEIVAPAYLKNAVSLNSVTMNLARAIGPTLAGILITTVGIASCFLFNALSYFAVILMVSRMRKEELLTPSRSEERGHVLDGFTYVRSVPLIRQTLLLMAVIGTISYEFEVSLPILGQGVFHADASGYAALFVAFGIGAVIGGLFAASRRTVAPRHLIAFVFFFGVAIITAALMPTLALAVLMMAPVGFFSINLTSTANTMIQLAARPDMRGRVMALWSMAMVGSTAVGGPLIGFIGEHAGGRFGLIVGGIVAIAAALFAAALLRRDRLRPIPAEVEMQTEIAEAENIKL
jgi:MFS family permease